MRQIILHGGPGSGRVFEVPDVEPTILFLADRLREWDTWEPAATLHTPAAEVVEYVDTGRSDDYGRRVFDFGCTR